jgi:2-succinyl-6-hydroxy-2,4-cyclohexadiene-1-carboxylate synthase
MGARVALAAAARRTAPLRALVLESGSPGLAGGERRQARSRADGARAAMLERDGIEPFVDAWLAQPLFRSQRALPESIRRSERERRLAQDPRALAACLRGLGTGSQPSFWAELGRIAVPTLLVTGRRDRKFDALAEAMAERLPGARRSRIAGAGHAVHLERPNAWLAVVSAFLKGTIPDEPRP